MDLFLPSIALIFLGVFSLGFLLLHLIALIDLLRSDFKGSDTKLVWVLVIIFVPLIGCILYLIMGRQQKVGR